MVKPWIVRLRTLFERIEPYTRSIAFVIAAVLAAMFVYSSWQVASDVAEHEAQIRFEFRANRIADAIRGRMVDYEQVQRGGVGLFAASESVGRREWQAYVEHLRIEKIYPGIQAIGYVPLVPAAQKARHEAGVHAEGYPGYSIRPEGTRSEYAPVMYIEPFNGRNLRAFGFDMHSEAERRATIERARDQGVPAASGRLTLVQETDRDVQAGFIMFLPVYRASREVATVSQRRAAIVGYIYSSFRADDLMRGILGKLDDVRLRVFDDGPGDDDKLLYDSLSGVPPIKAAAFSFESALPVHGRRWRLEMESLPPFEATVDRGSPLLVAGAAGAASALVLAVIFFLVSLRARAMSLARAMTRDLRDSRERLALAVEGSDQALFDWNVGSGKVTLSERWSRIAGCGPEGLSTTIAELQALIHTEDMDAVRRQVAELLKGQLPFYHVEHRVRTTSGEWRWISSRAKVVERDAAGHALRVAGTNVDITDRKEVERLKNEFIATVSHELRTPLTAIVGSLGLLKEVAAGKLTPDATAFLGMAQQNSERLAALINDILDIEKIESGQMEFRVGPVQLDALLERAASLNAAYAEKFSVRFELRPLPVLAVQGDGDRLLQVLTNLMSNAVKYSPAGAAVTLSAEARGDVARVMVTDRGPGVPESFRGRIFGKFAQADGSDTRRKGGTGLGLAISRAIVEKHGGTIDYDSVPGEGATFYFELPLKR